ncbi:hypothetical protein [Photobacterium leiognathi]|uniref:hypothetical protein n=1 Tax=Photobacterium leiognathi TaxID=553611 RepID=UPI0027384614|nr:hypothetical protein [Photobacterium leiognathi]
MKHKPIQTQAPEAASESQPKEVSTAEPASAPEVPVQTQTSVAEESATQPAQTPAEKPQGQPE